MCSCCNYILALILPPLAVLIHVGCTCTLLLNVVLTLFGWLPGVIHAYCVLCSPEHEERRDYPVTSIVINEAIPQGNTTIIQQDRPYFLPGQPTPGQYYQPEPFPEPFHPQPDRGYYNTQMYIPDD
ncbi:unnamed protein product [Medioppia subpectinata]|uniref:Uncharacterized protein n=1 Tax=Medioppia subpectinata TaxID=1979941 RepID=A0A7R9L3L4_9ACAR|nr:unnamed protein product [Medioppia subpectinata]CAG2113703.1 unnamed protein product [Medioppia subpectinata]